MKVLGAFKVEGFSGVGIFRFGVWTFNAICSVQEIVEPINKKAAKNTEICVLVLLDIANAFNSALQVINSMEKGKVSEYLINLLKSYLNKRTILTPPDSEVVTVTCVVLRIAVKSNPIKRQKS